MPLYRLIIFLSAFQSVSFSAFADTVSATWNSPTETPITAPTYTASGNSIEFTLNCVPTAGELTVIRNTGPGFIGGQFSNLAQGQAVDLTFSGTNYHFIANYYGGSGNDLVLVRAGTRAFAWGGNTYGELGDNTKTQRNAAVAVSASGSSALLGKTVLAVSSGASHSLALCSDGTLAAWGYNYDGELGTNSATQSKIPVPADTTAGISALSGNAVIAASAGDFHSLALCADGTVAAWGHNADGQLGDTTTTRRLVPVAVNTAAGSALNGRSVTGIHAGALVSPSVPPPPPVCHMRAVADLTLNSARVNSAVNANGCDTTVSFEYGTDGSIYPKSNSIAASGLNGTTDVELSAVITGLTNGATYYYRLLAANQVGITYSPTQSFITRTEPAMVTAGVTALSTTSERISGLVNAHGSDTDLVFDYGIDAANLTHSIQAMPALASGYGDTPVSAPLSNIQQGMTYYYRVRGSCVAGSGESAAASFPVALLSGSLQVFPSPPPDSQGFVFVTLLQVRAGGAWRFVGEQQWRVSGVPVGGLATGDREIEFKPVLGFIQPPRETVSITSGGAATIVDRVYYESAATGTGSVTETLKHDSIADAMLSEENRAQWRVLDERDTDWRNSGITLCGLLPGSYLVECKPVSNRTTPSAAVVLIAADQTTLLAVTYSLAAPPVGTGPALIPFETVSTDATKPYGFVGQIRSNIGSSSGFVVKSQVVATAEHVVFDDTTLSAANGQEWLFERDRGTYEPRPQVPRGFYVFDGYASQRAAENTPGTSSPQSQNLDAAALYFLEDAGRGGYGGFLASDQDDNEFLLSSAQKMLVGYPVAGIAAANQGRMHATPAANAVFARAFAHTYATADIRSSGANSGGPLCVQFEGGSYYPAAIYLGGSGQTVVRSIDSQVIALFSRAEVSGNGGSNNTGGSITHTSVIGSLSPTRPGSLKVAIEPAAAVAAGAGWRLKPEASYRASGMQKGSLSPGDYLLELPVVAGFPAPSLPIITVTGGQLTIMTFTYGRALTQLERWRLANFNANANTGNAADSADPDGDGQNKLSEYAADTHPNNPTDVFKILTAQKAGGVFTLTASGKSGRSYFLKRGISRTTGTWETVINLGPLAIGGQVALTDPAAPSGNDFYRIQVSVA
jgi:hypothetical protein